METADDRPVEGIVRCMAYRPTDGDPMVEIESCNLIPGRGIDTENRPAGQREVTLISARSWRDVCSELGQELPWHTRRANFLVEGIDLGSLVGAEITMGPVRIHIHGESKPCRVMDQQCPGLRHALKPDHRGGVFGQVLNGGRVRIGDSITLTNPARPADG